MAPDDAVVVIAPSDESGRSRARGPPDDAALRLARDLGRGGDRTERDRGPSTEREALRSGARSACPEAEIALAWSLLWLGRVDEAVQRAQAALTAGLDGAGSAAAITILFIDRLMVHGDVVAAERLLVDADTSGQAAAPRLLLLRIVMCLARSDTNGAAALFEELERIDESRVDALAASGEVAAALAQRGRFAEAFTMTERFREWQLRRHPHRGPSPTRQIDWRWCNKCQGLFFRANGQLIELPGRRHPHPSRSIRQRELRCHPHRSLIRWQRTAPSAGPGRGSVQRGKSSSASMRSTPIAEPAQPLVSASIRVTAVRGVCRFVVSVWMCSAERR